MGRAVNLKIDRQHQLTTMRNVDWGRAIARERQNPASTNLEIAPCEHTIRATAVVEYLDRPPDCAQAEPLVSQVLGHAECQEVKDGVTAEVPPPS